MKTKLAFEKLKFLFAALILTVAAGAANAQEEQPFSINASPLPPPTGFVNDYAGVIDAAAKEQIEQKIKNFKEKTNPQVELGVAIVKTTGGRPIEEYSVAVARGWKIGSKEDDNPSALLFIAIDDRKYFTQVSKDLQDELPDGIVGSLQRQFLVPALRQQNYAKGVSDTIDAYIRTIEAKQTGEAPPAAGQTEPKKNKHGGFSISGIICCFGVGLIFLLIIASAFGRKKGRRGDDDRWGGGFGGGGGSALPWVIGSILANSGSSSGSSSSGWGDSSGGGGSDWGGFGGGGDFDGGGAGGDW